MERKHKAFGIVRREIGKKIREHRRAKKRGTRIQRRRLDAAIRELTTIQRQLAATWGPRLCPMSYK